MPAAPQDIIATVVDPKAHADPPRLNAAFAWLRQNDPLAVAKLPDFDPFRIVTKHADILEISRDNTLFPYGDYPSTLAPHQGVERQREARAAGRPLLYTLVQMDEPDHMKYRALTQAWFMPQNIRRLEDRIRELARETVARMEAQGGECDFVEAVALHFPLRVIMEILGVPPADEPRMLKLTQELFGAGDPELNRSRSNNPEQDGGLGDLQAVIADFFMYFKKITDERKAHPGSDLASVIANGQIDGAPINDFEALCYYVIVATAGHDTTSSSTAGAIWGMCQFPEAFANLKADPALIPGLVDESIRWVTPVKHFMRSATQDTQLRGRHVKKGDWLMLCYPSGNRDEEVFDEPDVFRPERSPNRHLSFGYGAHLCLGQHLAKMEMRILWEEMIPRLSSLEFAGQPTRAEAAFVGGPKHLPIRFAMT